MILVVSPFHLATGQLPPLDAERWLEGALQALEDAIVNANADVALALSDWLFDFGATLAISAGVVHTDYELGWFEESRRLHMADSS